MCQGWQVAELPVAKDDLAARIGAELMIPLPAVSKSGNGLLRSLTVEDASLSALAVVERQPLLHEHADLRRVRIHGRVVGKCALWIVIPPTTDLGVAHTLVPQIR